MLRGCTGVFIKQPWQLQRGVALLRDLACERYFCQRQVKRQTVERGDLGGVLSHGRITISRASRMKLPGTEPEAPR